MTTNKNELGANKRKSFREIKQSASSGLSVNLNNVETSIDGKIIIE